MRHRVSKKKLDIDSAHRKALLKNLAASLIKSGKIETTIAKAKYVRSFVEKLITKSRKAENFSVLKNLDTALGNKEALRILTSDLAKRFATRAGGYTRITKLGFRSGDKAAMARIEFVEDTKKPVVKAEKKDSKSAKVATKKPTVKKKTAETKGENNE